MLENEWSLPGIFPSSYTIENTILEVDFFHYPSSGEYRIAGADMEGGFLVSRNPPCHFNIILGSILRLRETNCCISCVLMQYGKKFVRSLAIFRPHEM